MTGKNTMSKRFLIPKGALALVLGVSLLLTAGCGEEKKAPQKAKQVRQKIVVKQDQKKQAPAKAKKTVKPDAAASGKTNKTAAAQKKDTGVLLKTHTKILEEKKLAAGEWSYVPAGKIDPFAPPFQDKAERPKVEGKLKRREVPLTPLTRVDLSQLKLTAIILAGRGNKALVEEASGKGYVVAVGTDIGNKAGRVAEILIDRVVVDEEVENITGGYSIKKRELTLQKPPGEF
jgi:type IV pilus assembly protein PilP